MTYVSSLTTKPFLVRRGGLDGSQPNEFEYSSADAAATVATSGYFGGDGVKVGMRVNDVVYVTNTSTTPSTRTVHTVASIANGVVDLSDGTVVGAATNAG